MDSARLKINNGKTGFLQLGWMQQLCKCKVESINVNGCVIKMCTEVKYPAACMDISLTFKSHIFKNCRITMLNLYRIIKTCKSLNEETCSTLVMGLVISHLDYSNTGLKVLSKYKWMQRVHSFAAKVVLNEGKYSNSTEALRSLHWLAVKAKIECKGGMLKV